ncbi:unnamed protein product [Thelazia callipaeda]|uniref:CTNNB1 binding N-teminal domain-containing protein n=1 Tax=Thelazia callipaeda TaxID=103827 RepID=A0A0N5D7Q6_THECL|nr:unnamed protein product [Thelazia callipaeda]
MSSHSLLTRTKSENDVFESEGDEYQKEQDQEDIGSEEEQSKVKEMELIQKSSLLNLGLEERKSTETEINIELKGRNNEVESQKKEESPGNVISVVTNQANRQKDSHSLFNLHASFFCRTGSLIIPSDGKTSLCVRRKSWDG